MQQLKAPAVLPDPDRPECNARHTLLRVVHHLHGRIVLHQRQIAIHIVGGFTDWLADELACGIVIGFECFYQLAVFRREGFLLAMS